MAVDVNNAYNRYQAIKAGRAFEKYDIMWFEEPVWPDDLDGSALVAKTLDVPVASGELEYTKYGFKELLCKEAVDIVQPDVMFCGGITEWLKIAEMAEAFNIPVAPHAAHDVHAHLVAAVPNGLTVKYFLCESDMMLYQETLEPEEVYVQPSDKLSVGIEFDKTAIAKFKAT
ncbi:MAG: enolase C-terminal domain-like protein [Candidatus Caldarchaeum sp.]